MHSHFRHALADRLTVAKVAFCSRIEPLSNPRPADPILERCQLAVKLFGSVESVHRLIVSEVIQKAIARERQGLNLQEPRFAGRCGAYTRAGRSRPATKFCPTQFTSARKMPAGKKIQIYNLYRKGKS